MELPKRKNNRLQYYDYSSPNVYFITFCTKHMYNALWDAEATAYAQLHPPETVHELPPLSPYGKKTKEAIETISAHYPLVKVWEYAVMPNHVHLLLQIKESENGRMQTTPSINIIIGQLKGYVTKQMGYSVWQKLYHDHVVRNRAAFEKIRHYIEDNPMKWKDDCYYKLF